MREIVKDISKTIIIAFFCWLLGTIYTQENDALKEAQENLKRFLMYMNMNYPSQLLLSSFSNKERMKIGEELFKHFQDTEFDYVSSINIKYKLKPQEKSIIHQRILDIQQSEVKLRLLWVLILISMIILVRILKQVSHT